MRTSLGMCGLMAICASSLAQDRPTFDVVSLKHLGDAEANMIHEGNSSHTDYRQFRYTPGSVSAKQPLARFVQEAFGMKDFQVRGPEWLNQEIYELDARTPAGTTREVAQQMLQAALAERMGLVVRHEPKEYQVFVLVKIPGSTKLQEIAAPEPATFSYRSGMDSVEATPGMPISALVSTVTRAAGRPVLDETGLTGFYKVSLHWNAEPIHPAPGQVIHIGTDPAMLSALPQMGLKAEPAKRTLDSLVVEKVNKEPTAN